MPRRHACLVLTAIVSVAALFSGPQLRAAETSASAVATFAEAAPASSPHDRITAVGVRCKPATPHEAAAIVVLVDTSASQTGQFRDQSLDSLTAVLAGFRPSDRVTVAAVDVSTVHLAPAFLPATDPAVAETAAKLRARAPLGTTDFVSALEDAAHLLATRSESRVVLYIGDGTGIEGVDPAEFSTAIERLRRERIAVSAIGMGPQVNWALLAATAADTGGLFTAADAHGGDAGAAARSISEGLAHAVVWPENTRCTAGGATLAMLPHSLPPLRSDRDTIVLVQGDAENGSVAFELAGVPVTVAIPSAPALDANAYLTELARNASSTGLTLANRVFRAEAAELARLAKQAEESGVHESAVRLAEASLRRDPDNQAAAIVRQVALRQAPEGAEVLPPAAAAVAPTLPEAGTDMAELEAMRNVRAQQLERDVAVRLREARNLLTANPDHARDLLKDILESVRLSDDLDAAGRERLRAQVEARIRESEVRSREKLECDLAAERKAAIGRERARLNTELEAREARIQQLVRRYNELVEEGIRVGYAQSERYPKIIQGEAVTGYEEPSTAFLEAERTWGDQILRETGELYVNHPIPMPARELGRTAQLVAKIREYDAENYRTRRDQERGFMDELHLVDVAAIPFPDDPSIIYPNRESWARLTKRRSEYLPAAYDPQSPVEKRVLDALKKETPSTFKFDNNSLNDVKAAIENIFDIPVVFDEKALEGIDVQDAQSFAITANLPGMPLRSALRNMLGGKDLAYVVKDDALRITTRESAAEALVLRAYPVGDLVIPLNGNAPVNPFNMGGTSNQNQNNPMQGGGGGPNQGGVGFCWLAREVYGVHNIRWIVFRDWMMTEAPAWLRHTYAQHGEAAAGWARTRPVAKSLVRTMMNVVVESRLESLASTTQKYPASGHFQVRAASERVATSIESSPRNDSSPASTAGATGGATKLPDTILTAADLPAALAAYLDPKPAADGKPPLTPGQAADRMAEVRVSAQQLGQDGKFDEAIDLLSAAIACGFAEPWMFESLAVAMEADGRSREEIDRVLLSTADMSGNASDLLNLATYLARFGSDKQATRTCRKVVRLDPTNRAAYALAMTVAARTDDLETLAWACPGVLANEWPAADQEIVRRAGRLAKATIETLESSGKTTEAKSLRTAVDSALVRDLEIDVTWSGDADIDIMVEEPVGSVCSRSAPRSPSGGVLLGDSAAASEDKGLHGERYVATFALPGDYRVLVKRITGSVTANTVTVAMTMMKGTDQEKVLRQQVRVTEDDQILAVSLPDGRRREQVADAQLVQDVTLQRSINSLVLAQQLAAITDAAAVESMSSS